MRKQKTAFEGFFSIFFSRWVPLIKQLAHWVFYSFFFLQLYGWLSAIVTSQYASVRPTSFIVEEHDNFFPSRNLKSPDKLKE